MEVVPPIPLELGDPIPRAARAALQDVGQRSRQRLEALEQRLRQPEEQPRCNPTNSS